MKLTLTLVSIRQALLYGKPQVKLAFVEFLTVPQPTWNNEPHGNKLILYLTPEECQERFPDCQAGDHLDVEVNLIPQRRRQSNANSSEASNHPGRS